MSTSIRSESAVKERYAAAANQQEAALCCPVQYNQEFLKIIPDEVIERDYGCGDPSAHVREGETVLDLGSGTGKICFIAAQVVGSTGRVIGVDMTDDMLECARRHQPIVTERMGYDNVEFRKGRIHDLALDLEALDQELENNPISGTNTYLKADELAQELRVRKPLVATESVDVVVSNCVLNLVDSDKKKQLFTEIHRVLSNGGRAVISDIVCDEDVPLHMQNDPKLWSGCISGAFREDHFLKAFEDAGFHGVEILKFDETPWQTVNGIEFRSMTVQAFKGEQGNGMERNQAVIYKGPFKKVLNDNDRAMERGKRYSVCDKTYDLYSKAPYKEFFELIHPREEVAPKNPEPFTLTRNALRHPRETKGMDYELTSDPSQCCDPESSCC